MIDYSQQIAAYDKHLQALLRSTRISLSDARTKGNISGEPGVYRIFLEDEFDQSLYIGKTRDLRRRICDDLLSGDEQSHTLRKKLASSYNLPDKAAVTDFLVRGYQCQILIVPRVTEISCLEHYAIAALRPKLNDERWSESEDE